MIEPNTIYFVGSGPGDPELITLKAKKLLENADVVVIQDRYSIQNYLNLLKKTQLFMMRLFWIELKFMKY